MKMRLDRWLATLSAGSRSEVRQWIRGGQAAVNGRAILDPAVSLNVAGLIHKLAKENGLTVITVLHDLNLEIPDGKLMVVTGPNGGGKTTLAKLISGLESPLSGRITMDGEDITKKDITERARMGISYAFQTPVRFKGITVRRLIECS